MNFTEPAILKRANNPFKYGAPGRMCSPRCGCAAVAKIRLMAHQASGRTRANLREPAIVKEAISPFNYGAPGRIRTSDHLIRSQVLYPAELRARRGQRAGNVAKSLQSTSLLFVRLPRSREIACWLGWMRARVCAC